MEAKRLVFAFDFYAFLGFNGLVQAFGPTAAGHQTARKSVHNHDFAVLNDVVLVFGTGCAHAMPP